MFRTLVALGIATVFAVQVNAADTKYALTGENTKLTFVGKKPDGKHTGGFAKLNGTATVSGGDPTTLKADVDIDTESLHSDDAKLTAHLKSADFFDVKNQPKATFKVTKVDKTDKAYTVTGELTMCGKTKPVSFPASISVKDDTLSVSTTFVIDKTQWGMNYGKGKIEDNVELAIKVTAKK